MLEAKTFFDTEFDTKIVVATVQCPGCGRRLRCSCPACMERWTETTNGPGLGFTVVPDTLPETERTGVCDDGTTIVFSVDDFQECNDCGYIEHIDGWAQIQEDEMEYEELTASVIDYE